MIALPVSSDICESWNFVPLLTRNFAHKTAVYFYVDVARNYQICAIITYKITLHDLVKFKVTDNPNSSRAPARSLTRRLRRAINGSCANHEKVPGSASVREGNILWVMTIRLQCNVAGLHDVKAHAMTIIEPRSMHAWFSQLPGHSDVVSRRTKFPRHFVVNGPICL